MSDSALVAFRLWDEWLPRSTKNLLGGLAGGSEVARSFLAFVAAVHDIGKATPSFQSQSLAFPRDEEAISLIWLPESAGLPFEAGSCGKGSPSHALAGQAILERIMCDLVSDDDFGTNGSLTRVQTLKGVRSIASVIGCHHGKAQTSTDIKDVCVLQEKRLGLNNEIWCQVQRELVGYSLELSQLSKAGLLNIVRSRLPPQAASLMSGILIVCDWIASNEQAFPLVGLPSYGVACECGQGFEVSVAEFDNYASLVNKEGVLNTGRLACRADCGWETIGIVPSWQEPPFLLGNPLDFYKDRFEFAKQFAPRPVQMAVMETACSLDRPGLMIIEAPMGEGKTEAALAAAEVFARRTGLGGVCVALPTMATTDAMFARVRHWLEHLPRESCLNPQSICLAHGKAQLNEEYCGISKLDGFSRAGLRRGGVMPSSAVKELGSNVVVSSWMCGRKRGMLSNFVVCTVDQILMGALQMKHVALRQLSLANKLVIIDECHAYDMYMKQYLDIILEWLGAWHVPVILMSATLPAGQRNEMLAHYLSGWTAKREEARRPLRRVAEALPLDAGVSVEAPPAVPSGYPLLTFTCGDAVDSHSVEGTGQSLETRLSVIKDDEGSLVDLLDAVLVDGGCVGVVCNTVARAQGAAEVLASKFGSDVVTLVHARYMDIDRMQNEMALREMLGPDATSENGKRPYRHIVVGTQVLEQSLDIDFDLLVTDIAPIDLLLQRIGRCHRHSRASRPVEMSSAQCYIRGIKAWSDKGPHFSKGLSNVYDRASLMEALVVCGLTEDRAFSSAALPGDIPRLVQEAYGGLVVSKIPKPWMSAYEEASARREELNQRKKLRAHHCLLRSARQMIRDGASLTDWYSLSKSDGLDADYGPRAVRDTQETVEVMLLRLQAGGVYLMPWVGDSAHDIVPGAEIPISEVPDEAIARLALQSTVRLPVSVCRIEQIDSLIELLEEMDASYVGWWQESPWLRGQLALLLEQEGDVFSVRLNLTSMDEVWDISYTRKTGLSTHRIR